MQQLRSVIKGIAETVRVGCSQPGMASRSELIRVGYRGGEIDSALSAEVICEIEKDLYAEPWAELPLPTDNDPLQNARKFTPEEIEREIARHAISDDPAFRDYAQMLDECLNGSEQQEETSPRSSESGSIEALGNVITSFWSQLKMKACCPKYTVYTGPKEVCLQAVFELRNLNAKAKPHGKAGTWMIVIPGIEFNPALFAMDEVA